MEFRECGDHCVVVRYRGAEESPEVRIPATHNDKPVTIIEKEAFSRTRIKSVFIPASVTEIGDRGFEWCTSLENVTIEQGSNLTKIGKFVFVGAKIRKFVIPKNVKELEAGCFNVCWDLQDIQFEEGTCITNLAGMKVSWSNPAEISIPAGTREIPEFCLAFMRCLERISFEPNVCVTKIGKAAFQGSHLRSFTIPKTVKDMGGGCFAVCDFLSEIQLEEGTCITTFDEMDVSWTKVSEICIAARVREIPEWCFAGMKCLKSVYFEPGTQITNIGKSAFKGSGLTHFVIPKSVTEIGESCFDNCDSLTEVTLEEGAKIEKFGKLFLTKKTRRDVCLSDLVFDIDKYKQTNWIGGGGIANVHLYKKGESQVAVKLTQSSGDEMQSRFEAELKSLKSLSHPFIVSLHGYALPSPTNNHNFAVVMDYVSGGSLHQAIETKPEWFDDTAKVIIIYGVALGMECVHATEIIHCDLKPMNILIDENHYPRISDFESSRLFSLDVTMSTSRATYCYSAPELFDDKVTSKVDVYAFGVLLYEVLTGKFAFRDKTRWSIMSHLKEEKREPIPDSVTPFARELIEKCWAQNPDDRPTFAEICTMLRSKAHLLCQEIDLGRLFAFMSTYKSLIYKD